MTDGEDRRKETFMIGFNYGNPGAGKTVTPERMRAVRAMLDTPVKRGAVMEFDDRFYCACTAGPGGRRDIALATDF